ncbi:MAG: hypothetical protein LBL07_09280 [Tannerella sp.]|jgi:hypothetical protein|nr:hypothetical protein [Tannerella sp.]
MKRLFAFLAVALCFCAANKAMAQSVASGSTGACFRALTGPSGDYTLTINGTGAMDGTVIGIGSLALGSLHNHLKNDRDDLVGYWQCSLNRREHYPTGLRDKQDVRDTTGNILVDYTLFGYENEPAATDATQHVSTV